MDTLPQIKINLPDNKIIKRLRKPPADYDSFVNVIKEFIKSSMYMTGSEMRFDMDSNNEVNRKGFFITYTDENNAKVHIMSDADYEEALQKAKNMNTLLKVFIEYNRTEQNKFIEEPFLEEMRSEVSDTVTTTKASRERLIDEFEIREGLKNKKEDENVPISLLSDKNNEVKYSEDEKKEDFIEIMDGDSSAELLSMNESDKVSVDMDFESEILEKFLSKDSLLLEAYDNESDDENKITLKKGIKTRIRSLIEERPEKIIEKVDKNIIHNSICDSCGMTPIIGARFKCTGCEDFNLCEICEIDSDHPHLFIKIKNLETLLYDHEQNLEHSEEEKKSVEKVQSVESVHNENIEKDYSEEFEKIEESEYFSGGNRLRKSYDEAFENISNMKDESMKFVKKNITKSIHVLNKIKNGFDLFLSSFKNPKSQEELRQAGIIVKNIDETIITAPGNIVFKQWIIGNISKEPWPRKVYIKKVEGDIDVENILITTSLLPGHNLDIAIPIVSPSEPGSYTAILGLFDKNDRLFGEELLVSLVVEEENNEERNIIDYQKAMNLCEQGYGEFEVCLEKLKEAGGDEGKAANLLKF